LTREELLALIGDLQAHTSEVDDLEAKAVGGQAHVSFRVRRDV
jgi:hypothetical protein